MIAATCSRVNGPVSRERVSRVLNTTGWFARALTSMNWRLARPPIPAESASMSAPPAADRSPSSTRALSFSVCSRPTSHVPALAIAL